VTGDGRLLAYDASYVASKSVGLPCPEIPDLPSGEGEGAAPAAGGSPTTSGVSGEVAASATPVSSTIIVGPQQATASLSRTRLVAPRLDTRREEAAADAALSELADHRSDRTDRVMSDVAGWLAEQADDQDREEEDDVSPFDDVLSVYEPGNLDF